MREIRVVLIEDSAIVHRKVKQYLSENHDSADAFSLEYADTLASGLRLLEEKGAEVVVLDLGLPDSQGLNGLAQIQSKFPDLPVVILTATNDTALGERAIDAGAQDFLAKEYLTQGVILRRSLKFAIERQSMREQLFRQNLQLQERNRDLEAFSHSVAHDLRSPLTVLKGLTRLIPLQIEKHAPPEEMGQSWEDMRSAVKRMGDIIASLLQFATTSHEELKRSPVDLSAIAAEIGREQQLAAPERQVEFSIAPGAEANADVNLVRIVVANLLSNAWKYSSRTEHPRVEFGFRDEDGKRVFYVSDNGAGFDMAKAQNLFEPFRRLHSQSEFKGIGIGLATVKKIIERHGGAIRAESKLGVRTTFYFTLG